MRTGHGRALLACPDGREAAMLAAMLAACGYSPVTLARDAGSALAELAARPVALALTTAALPGGDGVTLARRIAALPLSRYPDVLILSPAGLWMPEAECLGEYGAAWLPAPATAESLARAAAGLREGERPLTAAKATRLDGLMNRLGVPCHTGRQVLANSVARVWRDRECLDNLKSDVYPAAGKPLGMTGGQAERALRHVIEAAWRDGAMAEQQRIFGDTTDARRGRPTCGEMIARLADILRREA